MANIFQTLKDLRSGRRSDWNRINKGFVEPTMKDCVAGDLALVMPHRIITNILEGLEVLTVKDTKISQYLEANGVKVKTYSNMADLIENHGSKMIAMDYKTYDSKISSMLEKIGNEASDKILDDVAVLLTDNQTMNESLKNKDEEIEKLKDNYSKLQKVNANLLLQIPAIKDEEIRKNEETTKNPKTFSYKDCFDEKGRFKN